MTKRNTAPFALTQHQLKPDLFDTNNLPFAAYTDADWGQLTSYHSARQGHYEKYTPNALAAAHSQFRTVKNPLRWGQNRRTRDGQATWSTITEKGERIGAGGRRFPGHALCEKDILRALTRSNVFAVGRCDMEVNVDDLPYAIWNPFKWPESVSCVIIDIDMDLAWAAQDAAAVRREVWLEGELMRLLGLQAHWAKTGGRGHQIVIPLPCQVSRSAASWLARIIAGILSPVQEPGQAVFDCTNVDNLVRLAGGRHAKTGDLSLFFDPQSLQLYPVDQQMNLLADAYRWQNGSAEMQADFHEAMAEVANYLCAEHGIRAGKIVERTRLGSQIAWDVANAMDGNLLTQTVRSACERLIGEIPSSACTSVTKGDGALPVDPPVSSTVLARAVEIWTAGYQPGGSWEWFTKGDGQGKGNGIWAAFVLFGDAEAECELLRQAERIGALSHAALVERRKTIGLLCESHVQKRLNWTPVSPDRETIRPNGPMAKPYYHAEKNIISGAFTPQMQGHVEAILSDLILQRGRKETGRKAKFQDRQLQVLRQLVSVFVLAFSQSSYVCVSRRTLAASIAGLWPEAGQINHKTLQNNLPLLVEGDPACLFPLLRPAPLVIRSMTLRGMEEQSVDAPNAVSRFVAGAGMEKWS